MGNATKGADGIKRMLSLERAHVYYLNETHIFLQFSARCRIDVGKSWDPAREYPLTACLGDPIGNPLEVWSIPRRPGVAPGERLPDMHCPRGLHRLTKKQITGFSLGNTLDLP